MRRPLVLLAVFGAIVLCAACQADAIHTAAAKGDLAKVKSLLRNDPGLINAGDKDGATPLHHAVAGNHIEVVKLLLSKGANVSAKKADGVTPLHVAVALNRAAIAKLLIQKGADPNAVDQKGRTPLTMAKAAGMDLLSNRGAATEMPVTEAAPGYTIRNLPVGAETNSVTDTGMAVGSLDGVACFWDREGKVHPIGCLPGDAASCAMCGNKLGQIAGTSRSERGLDKYGGRLFIWDQTSGMSDSGISGVAMVCAINNKGQVLCYDAKGTFIWEKSTGINYLGVPLSYKISLPPNCYAGNPMNDAGTVLLACWKTDSCNGAGALLVWDAVNGYRDLVSVTGRASATDDIAAVNTSGQILTRTWLWDKDKGVRDLAALTGVKSFEGRGLDDAGEVLGATKSGFAIWHPDGRQEHLKLPNGRANAPPLAIMNNAGDVWIRFGEMGECAPEHWLVYDRKQ